MALLGVFNIFKLMMLFMCVVVPSDACANSKCPKNAKCGDDGTCVCNEHFVPYVELGMLQYCLMKTMPGNCSANNACPPNSNCTMTNSTHYTCVCQQKCSYWQGGNGECIDMCQNRCKNGATCQNHPRCDWYSLDENGQKINSIGICPPSYTGPTCEVLFVPLCGGSKCVSNSKCVNDSCECDDNFVPTRYRGRLILCNLGTMDGTCPNSDCPTDSKCIPLNSTQFTCRCDDYCSLWDRTTKKCIGMCDRYMHDTYKCMNGGVCPGNPTCDLDANDFPCVCQPGFDGAFCEDTITTTSACRPAAKDIAFLLDRNSINYGVGVLQSVADMTRSFPVGDEINDTHFALVYFDNQTALWYNLLDLLTNEEIYGMTLMTPYLGVGVDIVRAISVALTEVFVPPINRPDVPNIIILITSGLDVVDISSPIAEAIRRNISLYVIAIIEDVGHELNISLLGDVPKNNVYHIYRNNSPSDALSEIKAAISFEECPPAPPTPYVPYNPFRIDLGLVFYYLPFCCLGVVLLALVINWISRRPLFIRMCRIARQDIYMNGMLLSYDNTTALGRGSTSIVYKGKMLKFFSKTVVAIKTPSSFYDNVTLDEHLQHELQILTLINQHLNIISFFGLYTSKNSYGLVFELAQGDLRQYARLETSLTFDLNVALTICGDIVSGMAHLASLRIIHRDLAARNILLSSSMHAKISDFGLSCLADSVTNEYIAETRCRLPTKWLSIEAFQADQFSEKSDIWSFGVLLYEFFSLGKAPYEKLEQEDVLQFLLEGHRLERPEMATDKIYDLMKWCWLLEPALRPDFAFLNSINLNHYDYAEVIPIRRAD